MRVAFRIQAHKSVPTAMELTAYDVHEPYRMRRGPGEGSRGACKHSLPLKCGSRWPGFVRLLCMSERTEPTYVFSEKQVAERSALARRFLDSRTRLNENVEKADNFLVKRFYNLDHNTYLEGALPAKYKELMGLVASACLRCDDCINYHIIQAYRLGTTRAEQEEAINVALVVGGSIVIPHLRRAYELLAELYG
jgi:AhpD family alkylhydroperoxidase